MWAGCPLWARHCPGVCVTVTGLPRTACQAQGRSCILLASAVGARLVCEAPAGHWRCSRESLNLGLPTQRMGIGLQTKSPPGCDCPVGSAPPSMSSSALRPHIALCGGLPGRSLPSSQHGRFRAQGSSRAGPGPSGTSVLSPPWRQTWSVSLTRAASRPCPAGCPPSTRPPSLPVG